MPDIKLEDTPINRQLYNAVDANNLSDVRKFLQAGAHPSATFIINERTYNILNSALANRNQAIVQVLLDAMRQCPSKRIDFSDILDFGTPGLEETWFYLACMKSSVECLRIVWSYQMALFKASGMEDQAAQRKFADIINKRFYYPTTVGLRYTTIASALLWRMTSIDIENAINTGTSNVVLGTNGRAEQGLNCLKKFFAATSPIELAGEKFPEHTYVITRGAADKLAFLCEHGCDTLHIASGHTKRSLYEDARVIDTARKSIEDWDKMRMERSSGFIWNGVNQLGSAQLPPNGRDIVCFNAEITNQYGLRMMVLIAPYLNVPASIIIAAAAAQRKEEETNGARHATSSGSSSSDEVRKHRLSYMEGKVADLENTAGAHANQLSAHTDTLAKQHVAISTVATRLQSLEDLTNNLKDTAKAEFNVVLNILKRDYPEYAQPLEALQIQLKLLFVAETISTLKIFREMPTADQRKAYGINALFGLALQVTPFTSLFAGAIQGTTQLLLDIGFAHEKAKKDGTVREIFTLMNPGTYAKIMSMLLIGKLIATYGRRPDANLMPLVNELYTPVSKQFTQIGKFAFYDSEQFLTWLCGTAVQAINEGKIKPTAAVVPMPAARPRAATAIAPGFAAATQVANAARASDGYASNDAPRRRGFFGFRR